MTKLLIIFCFFFILTNQVFSTTESFSYKTDIKTESLIIIPSSLLLTYSYFNVGNIEKDIPDKTKINFIDRYAVFEYKPLPSKVSDYLLALLVVSPYLYNFDSSFKENRMDNNIVISEAYLVTTALTAFSKTGVKRYRPYVYDENTDFMYLNSRDSQHSFFSGHTSLAFTSVGLIHSIEKDFYADKSRNYIGIASVFTASTVAYLRYSSGQHYISDILFGAVVGFSSGYFIPKIHKRNNHNSEKNIKIFNFSFVF